MQGLYIGIDLCDDYSQVCCLNPLTGETEAITLTKEESSCLIPTVICKRKTEDVWFIGEEAYRRALVGEGIMVDKLVKLAGRDGSATMEGVKYSAEELLYRYVAQLLSMTRQKYETTEIASLVFTIQTLTGDVLDLLVRTAERCGVSRDAVRIFSHTESFVYYVLSQQKDVWANSVSMFDLSEEGLHYYEMRVIRGRRPQVVEAAHEKLEEGFDLNVLDSTSGEHMGDTILSACAERMLSRKVISAVYLTGKGFVNTNWAPNFLRRVCTKRKVFAGQHVFASGAAYVARDSVREESAYPYTCLCEGRIQTTVSIQARYEGRTEKLVLAEAGTNWYEARSGVELIPDGTSTLELTLSKAGNPHSDRIRVDLSEFPQRPNKTTRIEVILSFTAEDRMTIRVIDRGFGELFPASGKMIRKDISI